MKLSSTIKPAAFAGLHAPLPLSSPPLPSSANTVPSYTRRRRERYFSVCASNSPSGASISATSADGAGDSDKSKSDSSIQYVPLHVHSDFSLLDGASQVTSLAARAAELGVPALALTDHGVLYGAIALVRACAATGVKPVIGNEMYVVNGEPGAPPPEGTTAPRRYHLIVLAKNTVGYRNLVKLTTAAHLHGKVGKGIFARPCINKAALFEHREGLIVSSGCLGGEVAQAIMQKKTDVARDVARWFRDAFGDDYYLEIQDHGYPEDRLVNKEIICIGQELGIKVVATNDSHFTSCLDAEAHDALICIQTGKVLTDKKRMRYAGNEFFKSVDEMRNCFIDHLEQEDIDEALQNTLEVADKIEEYDLFGSTRIPHYPVPSDFDNDPVKYLRHIASEGLSDRLGTRQASGLAEPGSDETYESRLAFELDMIERMGFASYFLVVWDYIRYARDHSIPVGPGRGSVAGSLVAFALRITDVDPIPFNLLFERFLNPERKSMPDIDTDFSVEGRERVIAYVSERYGKDRVAQIITFNRLTSKSVLKDIARVHNVPYSEADKLAKLIPVVRGKPATLTKMMGEETPSPEFKQRIEDNPEHLEWIEKARRIEGANKTFGIHAAGVVISSSPLTDVVPLSVAKRGETITQYPMEDVESLGLLKMDFLGLNNLTVIESALRFINAGRRRANIPGDLDFSVDALPLDDAKTFQLLATGELDGIFQLDASLGMRNIVRELKPASLEDISAVIALYRPGPLDAGLIPKFIRRKHGLEPLEYDHRLLVPILKDTYGIMVYQEQIMRIARDLAGYSLGEADILRRAMGKKKVKDMEKEKPKFIAGAVERGVPEATANNLFEMMIQFAEYCFNKSHSTAYAYLTYQTAYLKANYPVEYAAALLSSNMSNPDKLVRYLSDANNSGVKVKPPSINRSEFGFTVQHEENGEAVVMFGMEAVKTVGSSVTQAVISERETNGPYTGIIDLIERVNSRVLNKRSMSALVLCGAFDELHPNRKVLADQLESLLTLRRKIRDRRKRREKKQLTEEQEQVELEKDAKQWEEIQLSLEFESTTQPDFTLLEKLKAEKGTLGFYASGHPLYDLVEYRKFLDTTPVSRVAGEEREPSSDGDEAFSVHNRDNIKHGDEVSILSLISELNFVKTARGYKMAKWMAEDDQSRMQAIVFPSAYAVVEQERNLIRGEDTEEGTQIECTSDDEPSKDQAMGAPEDVVPAEKVVEQDARVVVWGRVDRESSGNVQLFVDDVQRVDDVKIVLVTAEYHASRPIDICRTVLRQISGKYLGLRGHSDSMSYTYQDKEGNTITRQRRPPKVDFSKKKRLPLVLRMLAEDGTVAKCENLGNRFRFGDVSVEELAPLAEKTGFHFEVVSMVDALKQECNQSVVIPKPEILTEEVVEVQEVVPIPDALVTNMSSPELLLKPLTEDSTVESEITEPARGEMKKLAVDDASELEKFEKFGVKRSNYAWLTDEEFKDLARESVRARERFQEKDDKGKKVQETQKVAAPVVASLRRTPSFVSAPPKSEDTRELAGVSVNANGPIRSFSTDLETSNVLTNNKTRDISPSRSPSPAEPITVGKEFLDEVMRRLKSLEIECAGLKGQLEERKTLLPETRGHIEDSLRITSAVVERKNASFEGSGINTNLFVQEDNENTISPTTFSSRLSSPPSSDSPITISSSTTQTTQTVEVFPQKVPNTNFAEMWKTTPSRCISPSISKRDGLSVSVGETGRLLDMICYVASDAAFKHCQGSFQLLLSSGFDLGLCAMDVSNDYSVAITARVASVDLNCLSVVVDVKEGEPSDSRKNCRTLTSGVMVFRAVSATEVPGIVSPTVSSKKARQKVAKELMGRVDTLKNTKRIGAAAWNDGGTKRRRKPKKNAPIVEESSVIHPADTVNLTTTTKKQLMGLSSEDLRLSDGGQLLCWMSAAAENCALQNVRNVKHAVMSSLELLYIPHGLDFEMEGWDEVGIRAKLSHAKGAKVTVDVALQMSKDSKATNETIQAVFTVECSPCGAADRLQFCESHSWTPFDEESMTNVRPLLEQLAAEMITATGDKEADKTGKEKKK